MGVTVDRKRKPPSEWRSTVRVYAKDPVTGNTFLLYAEGDDIPEDEARRQGLIGGKAAPKEAVEDKKVAGAPATKKSGRKG